MFVEKHLISQIVSKYVFTDSTFYFFYIRYVKNVCEKKLDKNFGATNAIDCCLFHSGTHGKVHVSGNKKEKKADVLGLLYYHTRFLSTFVHIVFFILCNFSTL